MMLYDESYSTRPGWKRIKVTKLLWDIYFLLNYNMGETENAHNQRINRKLLICYNRYYIIDFTLLILPVNISILLLTELRGVKTFISGKYL